MIQVNQKFLIEPADLPTAHLAFITPLNVGRGWLELAREAVMIAAGEPIISIKEKAGTLVVYLVNADADKRTQLSALRQASASICEICGAPGTLVDQQARCADHRGWRTCPPFMPAQLAYLER